MKKIGIGYENYKEFIDSNMYYVDKTLLIRDILEKGGKVTLFTRPRRFGKTLALSMLRTFFEEERDFDGNIIDKRLYFQGKKIMETGDNILSKMGKYPVIKLSLKSAKQLEFRTAFFKLREEIVSEFIRHSYAAEDMALNPELVKSFRELESGISMWEENFRHLRTDKEKEDPFALEVGKYATSIRTLSEVLKTYHKQNVIILIDEYDVPLENAYHKGFYDRMVDFIRSLFESSLKTNDALEFAVVTGCLRISKESIFTGLNNLAVNSIRGSDFGEYFGFTQAETDAMLSEYGLEKNTDIVKRWYDGYLFGAAEVYNPWSVIKYVSDHRSMPDRFPEPYWSNTSSNSIIEDLVDTADESVKEELDRLISGETIEKRIHEDITYDDIYRSEDNLWNFLFFTGYLKKVSERSEGDRIYVTMRVPNTEIRLIYEDQIKEWFDRKVKEVDLKELYDAIILKDTARMEDFISSLLSRSISYFDSDERFYHGFFLSLLYGFSGYTPKSNREEGDGRPDVVLYPVRPKDPAYLFELKIRKKFSEMDDGLKEAFDQITEKKYEEGILDDGYIGAVSFGICFCKKSCIVGLYHRS